MVQYGAIWPCSEMCAILIMQGILTSQEEVVGLAEQKNKELKNKDWLLVLSLPCAESNPGQVVFRLTVTPYLAITVKK